MSGRDYLPLYHVDGELNLSDLLTKKHDLTVEDLSTGSNWQAGLPWMKLGTEDMPLFPYQSLTITREAEELFFFLIPLFFKIIKYSMLFGSHSFVGKFDTIFFKLFQYIITL